MTEENPTTGDSGASIEDRLEAWLTADNAPASQPKEPEAPQAQEAPESAEVNSEEPKEGVSEEEKQPQLTTSELAKVFGLEESALDVDDEGNPVFKTKIDGKEVPAKLADLLKDYQIRGHAENKAREAAEAHKAAQARMQEADQVVQQRLAHVEQLANIAQQELMAEFQSYDWRALDQHPDQGAVAALKLKFQERGNKIQQAMQGVNAQRNQLAQKAEQERQQYLQAEAERLPQVIPEWKDPAVRSREAQEIIEWGLKQGYTQQQLQALNNSSALHVATVRRAMLFDKLQQSKPAIENKVRQAPKIVKSDAPKQTSQADSLRGLKANVTKTGGKHGSLEAYLIAAGKV